MRTIRITAQLTPAEEGGFVVYCPELDVTTEGETSTEALEMLKDAAQAYIEVVGISNIAFWNGKTETKELELVVNG